MTAGEINDTTFQIIKQLTIVIIRYHLKLQTIRVTEGFKNLVFIAGSG